MPTKPVKKLVCKFFLVANLAMLILAVRLHSDVPKRPQTVKKKKIRKININKEMCYAF